MQIRDAQHSDVEEIASIWHEFMHHLVHVNQDYYNVISDHESFRSFLKRHLMSRKYCILVAEKDQEIIGFLLAKIDQLPEWFGSKKIGLIRYLAVRPDHQKTGIGNKLVLSAHHWFKAQKISRIELYVLAGLKASEFWNKVGYKRFMDRRFMEL